MFNHKKTVKVVNEFIDAYVDRSAIREVTYNAQTNRWTITYTYDVPQDTFTSFESMIKFLHADQYSESI